MSPSGKNMDSILKRALREINYWNHVPPVRCNECKKDVAVVG